MASIRGRDIEKEVKFSATKAGGPGGQHVNKTSSAIELRFDVVNSGSLSEHEKEIIQQKLKNRINSQGELILYSSSSRSQGMNKKEVLERFLRMLENALKKKAPRKPTKPTAASKKKRIEAKKKLKVKKDLRKKIL